MTEELKRRLAGVPALAPPEFTIGVEHEVFVFDRAGQPSEAVTQSVLDAWGPVVERDGIVWATAARAPSGRSIVLKYDHHPHLLELAFSPVDTLFELEEDLAWAWPRLLECASVGCLVHHPVLDGPGVASSHPRMLALVQYRTELLARRGIVDPAAANYASSIAATQIHVGGLAWWTRPPLLAALVAREAGVAAFAHQSTGVSPASRWAGYRRVFEGSPFCGLPHFETWDLAGWASALSRASTMGQPDGTWDDFFARVRDFSVIRPRLFGTVEFRGDPAQPSPDRILRQAALRLGTSIAAIGDVAPDTSAAHEWWSNWSALSEEPAVGSVQDARSALIERGHGEERFLDAPLSL